ncbi:MAG: transposase, partial [Christensenellales bacterium]
MIKNYPREFKLTMAKAVKSGHSVKELAKTYGLQPTMLYRWTAEYAEYGESAFPGKGGLNCHI